MKKIFLIFFVTFSIFTLLTPAQSYAGLVPCGARTDDPLTTGIDETKSCGFCDIFVLINKILEFVLTRLVPMVAVLLLIFGGLYMLVARGNPGTLGQAKSILTATVVGMVIIFIAWVGLNTFLTYMGVANWTGLTDNPNTTDVKEGWWQIKCE